MAKFAQKGAREKAAVATGDKLAEDVMHQMTEQMGVFKDRLEAFALKFVEASLPAALVTALAEVACLFGPRCESWS